MAELVNEVRIGLLYGDGTTRSYTFTGVDDTEVANVATRIKAINADPTDNFHKTFVSDTGEAVLRIATGAITSTEETVIYTG